MSTTLGHFPSSSRATAYACFPVHFLREELKNFSPHLDSRSTLRFDAADIFLEDRRYFCTTSYVLMKNLWSMRHLSWATIVAKVFGQPNCAICCYRPADIHYLEKIGEVNLSVSITSRLLYYFQYPSYDERKVFLHWPSFVKIWVTLSWSQRRWGNRVICFAAC